MSGLRDLKNLPEGNDTPNNLNKYMIVSESSWEQLFHNFSLYSEDYQERDPGHPIFIKFTQIFVDDFRFYMFLTAAIFLIPFSLLIYRYVKSYLGIILVYSIYFSLFTIIVNGIMRQAIALGIILYSIKYIINSDWKKYFAFLLCAFSIHSSAIIAVPLFFMPKWLTKKKWIILSIILLPFFLVFSPSITAFLASGTVYEGYAEDLHSNPVNYVLLLILAVSLTIIYYRYIIKVKDYEILFSGLIGSIMLLPLIWNGGTLLRISYYYYLFILPLFTIILDNIHINKTLRKSIYILFITFFILYRVMLS